MYNICATSSTNNIFYFYLAQLIIVRSVREGNFVLSHIMHAMSVPPELICNLFRKDLYGAIVEHILCNPDTYYIARRKECKKACVM